MPSFILPFLNLIGSHYGQMNQKINMLPSSAHILKLALVLRDCVPRILAEGKLLMDRKAGVGKERKQRSDKKRDIKPVISLDLYETISRISYITNQPIKRVGEWLCIQGILSDKVINHLSEHFRRDFCINGSVYRGVLEKIPHRAIRRDENNRARITMRFTQSEYDLLSDLSYALDLTVASATGFLLESALTSAELTHRFIERHIESILDPSRMKQLQEVVQFINQNNPYEDRVTVALLVNHLVEELMEEGTYNIKQKISQWLDSFFS